MKGVLTYGKGHIERTGKRREEKQGKKESGEGRKEVVGGTGKKSWQKKERRRKRKRYEFPRLTFKRKENSGSGRKKEGY